MPAQVSREIFMIYFYLKSENFITKKRMQNPRFWSINLNARTHTEPLTAIHTHRSKQKNSPLLLEIVRECVGQE